MKYSTLHLLLVTLLWWGKVNAQAPGDGDSRCTDDEDAPIYADNEKTLMDSYHYLQLLPGNGSGNIIPGAVWNDRSLDRNDDDMNTINPTYWQQGAGGVCRFQVRVCGWQKTGADQNNWLFTQHINKDFDHSVHNPVQITVEVIYALQSCRDRLGCVMGFELLNYTTNIQQLPSTTGSGYLNTDNYEQFGRARARDQTAHFETYSFTLDPSETGFYVALQDTGTCVGISRLRVYHYICPSRQVGLVLYLETPALVSDIDVKVRCVDNATNYGSPQVTCHSNGTWGPENPVCKCDCGFEEKSSECIECSPGYFRSEDIDVCTPCPNNSTSDAEAACECPCILYHYRLDDDTKNPYGSPVESPVSDCTSAPSEPTNVTVTSTNTTVTVTWEQPVSDGGRPHDIFYRVRLRALLSSEDPVEQDMMIYDTSELTHTFRNLKPVTQYSVTVVAENGVSYLDKRVVEREVPLEITTAEGRPGPVFNPKAVDNVVLVWGPPKEPNGEITGYEVMLTFCPDGNGSNSSAVSVCRTRRHELDPSTLFFVLNNQVLPDYEHNLTFTIRGKTNMHDGVWSPEVTIVPKIVCPKLPSLPSPTVCTPPPVVASPSAEDPKIVCPKLPMTTVVCPTPPVVASPSTEDPKIVCPKVPSPTGCTTSPVVVTSSENSNCDYNDCVIYMAMAAGGMFLFTTLIMCVFSCTIACICHEHKMKTYKVNMKRQMQSKWEY